MEWREELTEGRERERERVTSLRAAGGIGLIERLESSFQASSGLLKVQRVEKTGVFRVVRPGRNVTRDRVSVWFRRFRGWREAIGRFLSFSSRPAEKGSITATETKSSGRKVERKGKICTRT